MSSRKQQARLIVQERYDALSSDEYLRRSRDAVAYLTQVAQELRPKKVLLYQARQVWREVAVADTRALFPGARCDIADVSLRAPVPVEVYDLIIIPLYGFTNTFYRLGHGGGWYDRLLSRQPDVSTIGVGLETGLVDFEYEPHDVRLDCIVTDAGVRHATRNGIVI